MRSMAGLLKKLGSFRWRHRRSLGLGGLPSVAAAARRKPTSFQGADGADALQLQESVSNGFDCLRAEPVLPWGRE